MRVDFEKAKKIFGAALGALAIATAAGHAEAHMSAQEKDVALRTEAANKAAIADMAKLRRAALKPAQPRTTVRRRRTMHILGL